MGVKILNLESCSFLSSKKFGNFAYGGQNYFSKVLS